MKIRFDGKEYDLSTPQGAADFNAAVSDFDAKHRADLATATARADAAEARAAKAEGEAKKAREDAADTARLDAAVEARVELESTARRLIGETFKPLGSDGKRLTDRQIREAVIRHDDAAWAGEKKDDVYVSAYFDAVVKRLDAAGTIDNVSSAITRAKTEHTTLERDDAANPNPEAARKRMIEANRKRFDDLDGASGLNASAS